MEPVLIDLAACALVLELAPDEAVDVLAEAGISPAGQYRGAPLWDAQSVHDFLARMDAVGVKP